ncbi:helix-turn-helix transcriptional regulator [Flavobacterium selenitireducens]|uniref:helix-turn-helix transcriptional regulator n=1 Tax=Flavobacterium selenitireducens TaxID=2722704 RepID=UPI00168A64E7|nr:helix-turn-helix transcriptional regulator [Flavobacterium selenitireducens]MBD3582746.1 helix-turn-helix transcriptional regulator [Flavobacterium selenitireducens]
MEILRIRELLSERKINGKDFAERVGVTPVSISSILKNKSFPKPELLLKIAEELDVDVRDLFIPTRELKSENVYVIRDGKQVLIGELYKTSE